MGFLKYILNHWRRFLALIIFLIFSVIFFKFFSRIEIISFEGQITEQIITIFGITLQNWGTILAILGTVATLFWGMYEYDKRRIVSQQLRASEIADVFSTEIVEKLSIISDILIKNEKFSNKLKEINSQKIKRFDKYEIKEILNNSKNVKDVDSFIKEMIEIIYSEETQNDYKELLQEYYSDEEIKKFPNSFIMLIQLTLNRLEYLCMNISSNAAGSQFIYQSLHQMFLQTVHILYVLIADKNIDNVDKYYTNIISVYNMWNEEKIKNIRKREKTNLKIQKLKIKMEKEIKKLLHIKSETV